jgi:hypothetical protein
MKYAVEMGLGTKIYLTKINKGWFRHSEVDGVIHRLTDSVVMS